MATTSISLALDRFTTFGDLLKYLRRRTGLTQRELSIAVGYSDTQISRLEQNERLPDLATLTARFLPALQLEDQPEAARRLIELAAAVRREDAPAVGLPPYKGLHHFEEKDAQLFFGRGALSARLYERLIERVESDQRFLAVIGASGSGKSSVVRAGLVPALRWQQPSSGWPVFLLTPTAHPLDALALCLSQESRPFPPLRKLVSELELRITALLEFLEHARQAANAAHSVLIVDHFEELFTLVRSPAEQNAFVNHLLKAAYEPEGAAVVVIVMRADFYAHCSGFPNLRQVVSQHQEYIGSMSNLELRRAIEEPARCGNWTFEPGLVELILHDIGADTGHTPEPGALPLLSHALLASWQRRHGRTLSFSGYTASGGVRGAIAETAESVFYDQLEPEQRTVARQIFLRLTELGGDAGEAGTRRRVSLTELASTPENREIVQEVLLALADARLITTDQDTAQIAHEALIREWPTLRAWLEEDRESLRLHRRLTEAAQEWELIGRDPGLLYRGMRLAQALEWIQGHSADANLLECEYLDASQAVLEKENLEREAQSLRELEAARRLAKTERARAEEQALTSLRLRQRSVYLFGALLAVAILAAAALLFAVQAMQAGRLAASRELAAASVSSLQTDPERSVLLALHAVQKADTLEARNALRRAVPELHILRVIPAHEGGVPEVIYNPTGTRLATMGAYGEVKVWDANSGVLLRTLEGPEFGGSLAYNHDGTLLAGAWVTQVVIWDTQTWQTVYSLAGDSTGTTTGYNLGVGQIRFSPDSSRLALANLDGIARVWELASQKVVLSLVDELLPPKALDYSPDGELLATGGDEGIVSVWDALSGKKMKTLSLGGIIHALAFSPDGALLAAASEDGRVRVWDADSGQEVMAPPRSPGLYDVTFLADGRFATGGQDGAARVYDPEAGELALTLAGPTSTVIAVAGSPDGRRIATGCYDGSVRIWDASPGRELAALPAHRGIVWDAAYSPDGSLVASAGVDGFIRVWQAGSNRLVLALSIGSEPVAGFNGLAFSPDGSRIAGGSQDGWIAVWDSQSGERLALLKGTNMVVGLTFSPDGTRLVSGDWDGHVRVWDWQEGVEIMAVTGIQVPALIAEAVFSPDGKTVFAGVAEDHRVYQWDVESGNVVQTFLGEDKEIYGIALSPDGSLLAAGHQDGYFTLWKVETGQKLYQAAGHAGILLRMVFSEDGSLLATAGFDRQAKVWEVKSGKELFSLYGNTSNVFGVSFSPDGQRLVSAGADGTLRFYLLDQQRLMELAWARLRRGLTVEECQKYLHTAVCP